MNITFLLEYCLGSNRGLRIKNYSAFWALSWMSEPSCCVLVLWQQLMRPVKTMQWSRCPRSLLLCTPYLDFGNGISDHGAFDFFRALHAQTLGLVRRSTGCWGEGWVKRISTCKMMMVMMGIIIIIIITIIHRMCSDIQSIISLNSYNNPGSYHSHWADLEAEA